MQTAPHPFTLRQLQYVVAIAENLSFRRAAERCRVAQPSLSAQIAQLEEALGVVLFERDRRRVMVTAAGLAFVERARRILVEADDLQTALRPLADPLAGTLRLGVIPTVAPYLLPRVTPALREAFPALSITWVEERTAHLARELADGGLDAMLLAREAPLGDVEAVEIVHDAFVLAAASNHPLARGRGPLPLADLRDVPVLLLDDGHCLRDQALSFCTTARAREREFRATSLPTLAQMVAGGAGVTLLPAMAVDTEAPRAGLRVRPLAAPAPSRTIVLAWRRSAPFGDALRTLARTLRDAARTLRADSRAARADARSSGTRAGTARGAGRRRS